MLPSHHQNGGQMKIRKIANTTFEDVAQFKYLGTVVRNQTSIQHKIQRRLNLGNACY
jgi:hypothetical protein